VQVCDFILTAGASFFIMPGGRDQEDRKTVVTDGKTVVPPGAIPRAINFVLGGLAG
jgi:hypothetical protein